MNAGDGRNVDLTTGTLSGEAADQRVSEDRTGPASFDVWSGVPSAGSAEPGTTYFDRPVLKEPVWIWSVPAYFFAGGAAGTSAFLGAVLQIVDRDRYEDLIDRCRYVAAIGTTLGTGFLIADLGRPRRFLNMLRVFRPTSAMSMGSWNLALAAGSSTAAAAWSGTTGARRALGDLAGATGAITGLPLAGYTAVLLADTAVPVWQASRRSLPWLFLSSGLSSTCDLLTLSGVSEEDEALVEHLGIMAKVTELIASLAVERDASATERVGRPLTEGVGATLWRAAKFLTASSLALSLVPGPSRARARWAALAGAAGGLALRFAVFHAGKASARDPRATFEQQRDSSAE